MSSAMKKYFLITIGLLLISLTSQAYDIQPEVHRLNSEYGRQLKYPIAILDKKEIHRLLSDKGITDLSQEKEVVEVLRQYFFSYHQLKPTEEELMTVVPYVTNLNLAATALHFYDQHESSKMNFCVVAPSGQQGDLRSEVERFLGKNAEAAVYSENEIRQAMQLMSLEEFRLFSLYHELSHCLDLYYIPQFYGSGELDGHDVHLTESFAETNALFLLYQRKSFSNLGVRRALLRSLYTKRYGPYLVQQPSGLQGPVFNQGGSVYFLASVLTQAQRKIENPRLNIKDMTLQQTLNLSVSIVENFALTSRSFVGIHSMFKDGFDVAIKRYKEMALKNPDLFMSTYLDMLAFKNTMQELDSFLD